MELRIRSVVESLVTVFVALPLLVLAKKGQLEVIQQVSDKLFDLGGLLSFSYNSVSF